MNHLPLRATDVILRRKSDGACFYAREIDGVILAEYRGAWIPPNAIPTPEEESAHDAVNNPGACPV